MNEKDWHNQTIATKVIIVRHGESVGNIEGEFQGRTDSALTPKGVRQALCVEESLRNQNITKIYSSPLQRAVRTAEIIRGKRDIEILTDERLLEMDCGLFEGMNYNDAKEMLPNQFHTWENEPQNHVMPEGESFLQVLERASEVIEEIVSKNSGKTILIVSHCLLIMLFMAHHAGEKINDLWVLELQCNTAINIVEAFENGEVNILTRGDCSHLKENNSFKNKSGENKP